MRRLRIWIGLGSALVLAAVSGPVTPDTAAAAEPSCAGDCNLDGRVAVDEVVRGMRIVLGEAPLASCLPLDSSQDGPVDVSDLVAALIAAREGCGGAVTPTPTRTPGGGEPLCGNGQPEVPEECDNGSVCVAGSKARPLPQDCTTSDDCDAGETCVPKNAPEPIGTGGGSCALLCGHDAECGDGGACEPVGGDGCAANCTAESETVQDLGESSWANVQGSVLVIPLGITGRQTWTIGKARSDEIRQSDGRIIAGAGEVPFVIKKRNSSLDPINVPNLACACLRGFETPRFGPGNAGAGTFTCDDRGLEGNDVLTRSDHSYTGAEPCGDPHDLDLEAPVVEAARGSLDTAKPTHAGACNVANAYALSGGGPKGSALLRMTLAISFKQFPGRLSPCTDVTTDPWFGSDRAACTADDPDQGTPTLVPMTTGLATTEVLDADNTAGKRLAHGSGRTCSSSTSSVCPTAFPDERCFNDLGSRCLQGDSDCTCRVPCGSAACIGAASGTPISQCANSAGLLSGSCLTGAFSRFDEEPGDIMVVVGLGEGCVAP